MHKLTFFPLGNADTCRIDLSGGEKLLFDYAAMRCVDDDDDKRIDLPAELRSDLDEAKRDNYDVVAFTHLDDDHTCGASTFFHLQHAAKYQGGDRIKIDCLWVPAAAVIEDEVEDEAKILQAEARYRLREGKDILVFSRPDKLKDWLAKQGLTLEERSHCMVDAGQTVPGFTQDAQGVEVFVHSPFGSRLDDGTLIDRNTDSIVVQASFLADSKVTKVILGSDVDHCALTEIVKVTKYHNREDRLEWDVFKLPHHCSYLSLGPDKGDEKTEPVAEVKWLFEEQAQTGGIVVSSSKPIPTNDDDNQPPHRQAANYHRGATKDRAGEFIVTMEHPKASAPEPIVIEIGGSKAKIKKRYWGGAVSAVSYAAPRAGA
jgi:hypothetical protein